MALGTALDRDDVRRPARARLRRRVPYPIAELPPELKTEKLLLFCEGRSAGWHLGAWSDGTWRAAENPDQTLEPTHFALASGLESEGGRWRHATPHRRAILSVIGVAGAAFLAMVAIGQVAYGDPWALCSPTRDGPAAITAR
jgi:hypothetical protein